ncbi:MAG: hypothetical protein VXZ72_02450, partial [Chlamydiota bacterium]|nr:hypothetical protein [Chlamydiota bacterium]
HSCSQGGRSEFFLSKEAPSFIGLDGNISLHIRMKQHVLLKVTEPFTLSVTGSLSSPKYTLH